MDNRKKIFKYIILNIIILSIIYFSNFLDFRICPVYNLFKIPCPGCGLTTSLKFLLKGDIYKSLQYNLLTIPLISIYSICSLLYIYDLKENKNTLKNIVINNKKYIFIFIIIIFFIVITRNITNPLLYKY